MIRPGKFPLGIPKAEAWGEKVLDYIEANRPISGMGTMVGQGSKGRNVNVKAGAGGGGSGVPFPWQPFFRTASGSLFASFAYGAVIDFTDWENPEIRPGTVGGTVLPDGELTLPGADTIYIYLKITQGTGGAISEEPDGVSIEAFTEIQTDVDSNIAFIPLAIVTTQATDGGRTVTGVSQILSSNIIWPLKPDFMGWQQSDSDAEQESAFWLGDQSPYRSDAGKLRDLWVQVRRDEFDNGLDGDSVFFVGMVEDEASYQLALHRSEKRGIYAVINNDETNLSIDHKNEVQPGFGFRSNDDEASLNVHGKNETASVEVLAGEDSAVINMQGGDTATITVTAEDDPKIEMAGKDSGTVSISSASTPRLILEGEDGGKANLTASENGSLSLDDGDVTLEAEEGLRIVVGSDTGQYTATDIILGGETFTPKDVNSGGSSIGKVLATADLEIEPLPPCIEWDEDTGTLEVGADTAAAISTLKLLADGAGGKIALNNVSNPTLTLDKEGGNIVLSANADTGSLSINDGEIAIDNELGFQHTDDGEGTQGVLSANLLQVGNQSGDGVNIDIADIGGKGLIEVIELDVCHMGAPGKRRFVCTAAYAP